MLWSTWIISFSEAPCLPLDILWISSFCFLLVVTGHWNLHTLLWTTEGPKCPSTSLLCQWRMRRVTATARPKLEATNQSVWENCLGRKRMRTTYKNPTKVGIRWKTKPPLWLVDMLTHSGRSVFSAFLFLSGVVRKLNPIPACTEWRIAVKMRYWEYWETDAQWHAQIRVMAGTFCTQTNSDTAFKCDVVQPARSFCGRKVGLCCYSSMVLSDWWLVLFGCNVGLCVYYKRTQTTKTRERERTELEQHAEVDEKEVNSFQTDKPWKRGHTLWSSIFCDHLVF